MSVKKDFVVMVMAILQCYYQYLLYAFLIAVGTPMLFSRKKQRLVPGIPIVGIEEPGGIKQARENFSKDAKSILTEGYLEACRLQILCLRTF